MVPDAAFKTNGKMFAGSFDEVLASPILRACFEDAFVSSLSGLRSDALFLALGKTPLAALRHCADLGALSANQVLGALAHPSRNGGSEVGVFLREKSIEDLNPDDPVRHRAPWLLEAHDRLKKATDRLRAGLPPSPLPMPPTAMAPNSKPSAAVPVAAIAKLASQPTVAGSPPASDKLSVNAGLWYRVSRGKAAGTILRPHE